tara:strand:+ start:409 stop:588 length:180 start_codon:yes stop_codon:yes gene_type:complete
VLTQIIGKTVRTPKSGLFQSYKKDTRYGSIKTIATFTEKKKNNYSNDYFHPHNSTKRMV